MASFTSAGDNVTLDMKYRGDAASVAISGTYAMTIELQREQGNPGSGSWEMLERWNTANATVAHTYVTKREKERLRLFATSVTSGTATATLTDSTAVELNRTTVGKYGDLAYQVFEGPSGPAFVANVTPVTLDQATYTLSFEEHANRPLYLARSGGIDLDLPQSTGSGKYFDFYVTVATADAYELSVFDVDADGICQGVICGVDDAAEFTWGAAATDNTVTLGGASQATGGTVGDWVRMTDIGFGVYSVRGFLHQGGSEATPFSTDS